MPRASNERHGRQPLPHHCPDERRQPRLTALAELRSQAELDQALMEEGAGDAFE
ncbi:hypothetical protein [Streptomyces europaeiscabiei]|uniref:hypothetical protein n=1 Tax=Streptomyces europaeiscabiei TaxID=146819 RepID=UPI0029BC146B|nr:hypothetical protein [Streptomyces europaeiscabiei]MDX3611312.1 hypothetical protein [Streptomyces europaeiscabiei]